MDFRLDHIYEGTAYPAHWGGRVERDRPVQLAGRFQSEDFQDGAGILLVNEDRGELMGWVVRRPDWPKVKYAPLPVRSPGEYRDLLSLAEDEAFRAHEDLERALSDETRMAAIIHDWVCGCGKASCAVRENAAEAAEQIAAEQRGTLAQGGTS